MSSTPVINRSSLASFKRRTGENEQITKIIREDFRSYLYAPILDVGAGIGDIALAAFPDVRATLVDRLEFADCPLSPMHCRIKADFFDIYRSLPELSGGAIIYSHVLQYLDDKYSTLIEATQYLHPHSIITVTNYNEGVMGALVEWSLQNVPNANPEVILDDFPTCCDYTEKACTQFDVFVSEPTFQELAKQVAYLMDIPPGKYVFSLENFLKERLKEPCFEIVQSVKAYTRDI